MPREHGERGRVLLIGGAPRVTEDGWLNMAPAWLLLSKGSHETASTHHLVV